ncbi:GA module-containing protein [Mycoplasma nasistruthionis]|uniref:Protein G-related albumin-binding (GA) module domain-containing protein n=1 Tax=Mycoplasma nasistruthionis TaxID=353852 RepID=A0A5B7XX69_9MOLU|nr:GA module-containing protein [Mycoplasma nasistruthionis]QCZ36513.1 hypothetical protein FG904_00555 [Mycoplasma nasistruthionis]
MKSLNSTYVRYARPTGSMYVLDKPKYLDASETTKTAFDNSVDLARRVLERPARDGAAQVPFIDEYLDVTKLEEIKNQVVVDESKLDGVKQGLINKIKSLASKVNNQEVLTDKQIEDYLAQQQASGFLADSTFKADKVNEYFDSAYQALVKDKVAELLNSSSNLNEADKQTALAQIDAAKSLSDNPALSTVFANAKTMVDQANQLVTQINEAPTYEDLTEAQKTALINDFKNSPRFYEGTTFKQNAVQDFETSKVNPVVAQTTKLKQLVDKIKEANTLASEKYSLSANKDAFDTAFANASGNDFSKFDKLDPTEIENIYNELKTQYDALNGYKSKLQKEIDATDQTIKDYIGTEEFNNATNIDNVNIENDTQYTAEYNKVLANLKEKMAQKVDSLTSLNDAQKQALKNEINDPQVNTFNALKPFIEKANNLNTAMEALKEQVKAADTFSKDNQDIIPLLTEEQKHDFNSAFDNAQLISPLNGNNGSNADKQTVDNATNALKNALAKIQVDALKKAIEDKLAKIDDNSSAKAKEVKTEIQGRLQTADAEQLRKDLATLNSTLAKEELQKAFEQANALQDKSTDLQSELQKAQELLNNGSADNSKYTEQALKLKDLIKANALEKLVKQVEATGTADNPNLAKELQEAKTILDNKTTSQYDNALAELQDALNKKDLEKAIAEAEKQDNKDTYLRLKNALTHAKEVYSDKNSSAETIKAAEDALKDAIEKAKKASDVRSVLQDLVDEIKKDNASANNEIVKPNLTNAESKLADQSATPEQLQKEVNKLTAALPLAKLDNLVKQAEATDNKSQRLTDELKKAKDFLEANKGLITDDLAEQKALDIQNQADAEYKALNNAIVKEKLAKAIADASALPNNNSDAFNKLQEAIKKAHDLYNNLENKDETAINDAIAKLGLNTELLNLDNAIKVANAIEPKSDNLKDAITNANSKTSSTNVEDIKNAIAKLNTAVDKNPLNNAVAKAKDVLSKLNEDPNSTDPELAENSAKLQEAKQAIENAIAQAETKLNEEPVLTKDKYQEEANKLDNVVNQAITELDKLKQEVQKSVDKAKKIGLNNQAVTDAEAKVAQDSRPSAKELIDAKNLLDKEIAKKELQNAIEALDADLKDSETFQKDVLQPINNVLNDANSTKEQFEQAKAQLENAKTKKDLFKALDEANKQVPINESLQNLINQNKAVVANNDAPADANDIANRVKELEKAIKANELQNLVNQANNVPNNEQSEQLKEQINNAQQVLDNNNSTPQEIQQAKENIQKAIDNNKLNKVLADAKAVDQVFDKLNDKSNATISNEIKEAIKQAETTLNNPSATKEQKDQAANELNKVVEKANNALNDYKNDQKQILDNLVKEAEALEPKSTKLQETLKKANAINDESSINDIIKAVEELSKDVRTNPLDVQIEKAPSVSEGRNVPNELDTLQESKDLANDPNATTDQINKQAQKQELNNYKIDQLAELDKLNNLTDAQKDKIKQQIIDATDTEQAKNALDNAKVLETAMEQLKQVNNDTKATLTDPNSPSHKNYVYAENADKQALDKLINDATNALDNGSEIDPEAINKIKNDLEAQATEINKGQGLNNLIDKAQKALDNQDVEESNQYKNAPTKLQDQLANAKAELQEALKTLKEASPAKEAYKTDVEDKLNQLEQLKDKINQFSDQPLVDDQKNVGVDLNSLDNLSESTKNDFFGVKPQGLYNVQDNKENTDKVVDLAKQANQLFGEIKQNLSNNDTKALNDNKVALDALKQQIDQLVNAEGAYDESNKPAFNELNNLVDVLNDNNMALLNKLAKDTETFKNSDLTNNPEQQIQALNDLIDKVNAISVNKDLNSPALNAYDELRNTLTQNAQSLINAYNELKDGQKEEFNKTVNNNPVELKDLDEILDSKKYFDIKEKLSLNQDLSEQEKQDAKDIIKQLETIKEANNEVPDVLIDLIKNELNKANLDANSIPWWPFLVVASGLLWLAGLAFILLKK